MKCPLFPIADVQIGRNWVKLGSAYALVRHTIFARTVQHVPLELRTVSSVFLLRHKTPPFALLCTF